MITAVIGPDQEDSSVFCLYVTESENDKYYQLVLREGILVREEKSAPFSVIDPLIKGSKELIGKIEGLFKEPFKFE